MHTRTPGPNQSPRNIDQLFKINIGQQQPVPQTASAVVPSRPQSVTRTTSNASTGASQRAGNVSTRLPQLNGLSAGHVQSDQAESSSRSRAPVTSALPRSVQLTEAVRQFLANPVTGPCRPIFFDLETTGTECLLTSSSCLTSGNMLLMYKCDCHFLETAACLLPL